MAESSSIVAALRQSPCLVLVEPQGAGNIGSVARAMKNFGFGCLRLVRPKADHLSAPARNMAVSAADLLEQASCYPDLPSALADCVLSVGTTRRFGKYRQDLLWPEQAAAKVVALAEESRVALVFGRENNGLSTAELDCCQCLMTIPTHDALPSMNLAQAVAIFLYALAVTPAAPPVDRRSCRIPASGENLEGMLVHMERTLRAVDFLDRQNPKHLIHILRRMFGRMEPDEQEVRILRGIWSKIDWLNRERKKEA